MTVAAVYTDDGPVGICIDPYWTKLWLKVFLFPTMEIARTFITNRFIPPGRKNPMWRLATEPVGNDGFGDVIDHI